MDSTPTAPIATPYMPRLLNVAELLQNAADHSPGSDGREQIDQQCALLWLVAHSPAWRYLHDFERLAADAENAQDGKGWEWNTLYAHRHFSELREMGFDAWRAGLAAAGCDDPSISQDALSVCNSKLARDSDNEELQELSRLLTEETADDREYQQRSRTEALAAEHTIEKLEEILTGFEAGKTLLGLPIEAKEIPARAALHATRCRKFKRNAKAITSNHRLKARILRIMERCAVLYGDEKQANAHGFDAEIAERKAAALAATLERQATAHGEVEDFRRRQLEALGPVDVEEGRTPLGSLLRAGRERSGLSTADAARLAGMSRATLARWERSAAGITPKAVRLIRATGIPAERALDALEACAA